MNCENCDSDRVDSIAIASPDRVASVVHENTGGGAIGDIDDLPFAMTYGCIVSFRVCLDCRTIQHKPQEKPMTQPLNAEHIENHKDHQGQPWYFMDEDEMKSLLDMGYSPLAVSVAKWRRITYALMVGDKDAAYGMQEKGTDNCGLCDAYYYTTNDDLQHLKYCGQCPVALEVGNHGCEGSPHDNVVGATVNLRCLEQRGVQPPDRELWYTCNRFEDACVAEYQFLLNLSDPNWS